MLPVLILGVASVPIRSKRADMRRKINGNKPRHAFLCAVTRTTTMTSSEWLHHMIKQLAITRTFPIRTTNRKKKRDME